MESPRTRNVVQAKTTLCCEGDIWTQGVSEQENYQGTWLNTCISQALKPESLVYWSELGPKELYFSLTPSFFSSTHITGTLDDSPGLLHLATAVLEHSKCLSRVTSMALDVLVLLWGAAGLPGGRRLGRRKEKVRRNGSSLWQSRSRGLTESKQRC